MEQSPFLKSVAAEAVALKGAGLERTLRLITAARGPVLELDGRSIVAFTTNDYLGLAGNPILAEAMTAAALQYGAGATASRLIAGNWAPHANLEAELTEWKGTEAALLFGSGYQANVGVITALVGKSDLILSDALNHASLIDGCRLSRAKVAVFRHGDVDQLDALLRQPGRRKLVVSDSLFSMDGDRAPITELLAVCRTHGAVLLLDEAHAAGVLGQEGRGLAPVAPDILQVGTFGKALGVYGAYVTGSRLLVNAISQRARSYIYTTALPPPVVAAVSAALRWSRSDAGAQARARLASHAADLHGALTDLGVSREPEPSHIVALYAARGAPDQAMAATAALLADGIYIQGIRPPTVPAGTSRLRLALSAAHTAEHLQLLIEALRRHRGLFASPSEVP